MTERITGVSPGLKARIAGSLWLIVIVAGSFALMTTSSLIVRNEAAATANNILASELLFRVSVVADIVAGLCYVGVTVLLYGLLKPVSRSFSLLAAFFGLGGFAIGGPAFLSRLAALVLLEGDQYLSVFTTSQLQAMALTSLQLHVYGFHISLMLFGPQCIILGYLIVRSTFLPRILGVLLAIGGVGYIVSSFGIILSPSVGVLLSRFVLPAGLVGEGSLTLWLLLKGVNNSRWAAQAGSLTRRST